ncbi:xanthine dehydrogenase family protein molybdopterin-binding subunit [Allohahella marinimesophila]|uniref:Xanthine dehydrogenase family protein molybdopterin-binding subunit n=1 Tax=Allohahella marinimesophila TaxID=1054972 RepID=A0ABP7PII0_9GAMM
MRPESGTGLVNSALPEALSRRHFLKGTGAMAIGFSLLPALMPRLVAADTESANGVRPAKASSSDVDAWLLITGRGELVIYSGKVELGTGVETALRQIVAEELLMPMAATRFIQGDTQLTPDQGYTAGSNTINQGSVPMRRAAATARRLLFERAAEQLQVQVDQLTGSDGNIHVAGDEAQAVSYASLIGNGLLEASIDQELAFLDADRYRLVGQSIPRVDIPSKVFGRFTYVHDLTVAGMLHARVIRPPDTGATRVTAELKSVDRSSIPAGVKIVQRGNFLAVVAEKEWQAISAADALKVEWHSQPRLPRMEQLYTEMRAMQSEEKTIASSGDANTALGEADETIEAVYQWPYQMHDSIGPSCSVANVTADSAEVWSSTQGVYPLRSCLADLLSMPEDAVRVIYVEGSGCYGHNGADDVSADAALISQIVGKPVRVQWSRADEHGWNPKGPAMVMVLKGGLSSEGDITSWTFDNWTPPHLTRPIARMGAKNLLAGNLASDLVPDGPAIGGDRNAGVTYRYPNYQVTTHWIPVERSPLRPSALRALGGIQNSFANESFVDELAHAAGADPVAMRLNYLQDERAIAVIKAATEKAGWQARKSPQRHLEHTDEMLSGRGMAYAQYKNGSAYVAIVAEVGVSVDTGIHVGKITVAHDCGLIINPDGLRNQIEGNVLQGISRTLKEEVIFDQIGVTSLEWGAYPILTFADIPEVDIVLLDRPELPPLGAGEPTIVAVPAAIANAVFDATGLRLRTVPFTRQRLKAAFSAA